MGVEGVTGPCGQCGKTIMKFTGLGTPVEDQYCPKCDNHPTSPEGQIKDLQMCIERNDEKLLNLSEELISCKRENDLYKKKISELEDELIHDLFDRSNFEGRPNA